MYKGLRYLILVTAYIYGLYLLCSPKKKKKRIGKTRRKTDKGNRNDPCFEVPSICRTNYKTFTLLITVSLVLKMLGCYMGISYLSSLFYVSAVVQFLCCI